RSGLALVPAIGGVLAALERQHPLAAQTDLAREVPVDHAGLVAVAGRPRGHEADVVLLGRQHVAGSEVARTDPVAVGSPLRRDDRLATGQQDEVVDRDLVAEDRDAHGPVPADVSGKPAREALGPEPVPLVGRADMVADRAVLDTRLEGGA